MFKLKIILTAVIILTLVFSGCVVYCGVNDANKFHLTTLTSYVMCVLIFSIYGLLLKRIWKRSEQGQSTVQLKLNKIKQQTKEKEEQYRKNCEDNKIESKK